jgi:hypothetical protein
LHAADFLRQHIYGRSRVPPLTALLQRQFRPAPPLPLRRDSLLISRPDWFVLQVLQLETAKLLRILELLRGVDQVEMAADTGEEDELDDAMEAD